MTAEQALALIRRVVEGVSLTYADHKTIQQALDVLGRLVVPAPLTSVEEEVSA